MVKTMNCDKEIHNLNINKLKEKEINLFTLICSKIKNENRNQIILTFEDLKEFSNYFNTNTEKFKEDLKSLFKKLLTITIEIKLYKSIQVYNLFESYQIETIEQKISVQINQNHLFLIKYIPMFNKLELFEFMTLKSSYAKIIFKLLKQFNTNNCYIIEIEQFKILLDIPISYKMSHIDSFILTPTLEQLAPFFYDLKLEKVKKGVKIAALKFSWKLKNK